MASLQGYVDRELHAFRRCLCHAHHVRQPADRVLLILQDGRAIVVSLLKPAPEGRMLLIP